MFSIVAALCLATPPQSTLPPRPPQCTLPIVKVKQTVIRIPAVTYRAPIGHTHTCANGHTWDHTATAGHNCPICGLPQYVQDARPRMVTVVPRASAVVARPAAQYHDIMQSLQGGGCASGNCPNQRR